MSRQAHHQEKECCGPVATKVNDTMRRVQSCLAYSTESMTWCLRTEQTSGDKEGELEPAPPSFGP